jgi:hypothetical protein
MLMDWIIKMLILHMWLKMQKMEDEREPIKKDDMYLRSKL